MYRSFFVAVILLHLTTPSLERRVPYGPTVDPGVFVITQVRTCRGGQGYCILGHSCEIDKDFLPDDLGGHCKGLEKAFYPSANFICCRENPANAVGRPTTSTTTSPTTTTASPPPTTSLVTEIVMQTEQVTELVTLIEEITDVQMVTEVTKRKEEESAEERTVVETEVGTNLGVRPTVEAEVLRPGLVIDGPSLVEEILIESGGGGDGDDDDDDTRGAIVMDMVLDGDDMDVQVSKENGADADCDGKDTCLRKSAQPKKALRREEDDQDIADMAASGVIKTTKIDFEPERDELFAAVSEKRKRIQAMEERPKISSFRGPQKSNKVDLESQNAGVDQQRKKAGNVRAKVSEDTCGQLGGRSVLEAFGRAADGLLPDLVANWVTGHPTHKMASEYIGGGAVTSTVIYCWMAAVVSVWEDGRTEFLCTGSLVKKDLIVTSASCANYIRDHMAIEFHVILGDSNLNIDLPFGVQSIAVSSAVPHDDFSGEEGNDIGLIRMKEPAQMTKTVCLLCLPRAESGETNGNCTAVSYGTKVLRIEEDGRFRASAITDDSVGILRTSEYPAVDSELCGDGVGENLLCYGEEGFDQEEDCKVALDVGSPVVCSNGSEERHELTGLLTSDDVCARDKKPRPVTKVASHLDWIQEEYEHLW